VRKRLLSLSRGSCANVIHLCWPHFEREYNCSIASSTIAETMKQRQWLAHLGERWSIPHSSVSRTSRRKNPMTRLPVTAAGHVALEEELRHRIRVARPCLVQRIQQSISEEANLIENSEYQAALAEQELNETRIVDLENKLARAEIVDVSKLSGDTIKFGATVTLIDDDTVRSGSD